MSDNSNAYAIEYRIRHIGHKPKLHDWSSPDWRDVAALSVDQVRPESSSHHPETVLKLQYDEHAVYGMFRVRDRYVRCIHQGFNVPVCKDSCVEAFLEPVSGKGYFNFEFNCGGALLCSYNEKDKTEGGSSVPIEENDLEKVVIVPSMPPEIDPELTEETVWTLGFAIPFSILEAHVGPLAVRSGSAWRANFYKCAGDTSHPHWISWSPVPKKNFHMPEHFGNIVFGD
jgi:hypothetical protein